MILLDTVIWRVPRLLGQPEVIWGVSMLPEQLEQRCKWIYLDHWKFMRSCYDFQAMEKAWVPNKETVRFEYWASQDQNQMRRLDFVKIPTAHIVKTQFFNFLHVQKGFWYTGST